MVNIIWRLSCRQNIADSWFRSTFHETPFLCLLAGSTEHRTAVRLFWLFEIPNRPNGPFRAKSLNTEQAEQLVVNEQIVRIIQNWTNYSNYSNTEQPEHQKFWKILITANSDFGGPYLLDNAAIDILLLILNWCVKKFCILMTSSFIGMFIASIA